MAEAAAWAEAGAPHGALVTARHQTAGRGRHGRAWTDAPGASLMLSLVLRPRLRPDALALVGLAAGLALAEALDGFGVAARVKWPNDVRAGGRKLAGVLAEARWTGPHPVVLVGLGLNVAPASVPASQAGRAASLADVAARPVGRLDALGPFLDRFERRLGDVETAPDRLVADVEGRMEGVGEDRPRRVPRLRPAGAQRPRARARPRRRAPAGDGRGRAERPRGRGHAHPRQRPGPMTLVTGATGFVGSVLVRQLVEAGESVRVLRRPDSRLDLLGPAAHRVEHALGDVTDAESVREAMRGVRDVYHVAAAVAFGPRARRRLWAVNVRGTAHVVDAAREAGVRRLVHTSSIAALGRPEALGASIDESAVWTRSRQNTAYAESKRAAELEVLRAVAEGLDAVIVNPALVFGPGRSGEGTTALVERVAAGRVAVAPPGGTAVVDVEDVALGLRAALARGATGERHVLAAENLPWPQILALLADAFDVAPPRWTASPRLLTLAGAIAEAASAVTGADPGLTRATARTAASTYRYSNRKAVEELGLRFRPFAATTARLAEALSGQTATPPKTKEAP